MSISLNNSKDIVANSLSIIKGNKTIDVLETIDAVQGLAPETLNSLEKLANALNGDSNYFQTVATAISDKADKSTTHTRSVVDQLIDSKVDDTEMTNYATKATTYPITDVDTKFTNIINGAPDALNTLKELSDALGANANFSTMVLNQIGTKANTTDVTTPLATKANTADVTTSLATKANTADFTTSLATKANTADVTTLLATSKHNRSRHSVSAQSKHVSFEC